MQGRQEPGAKGQKPLDRSATAGYRLSDLTGRQPVIPKRPPGIAHIDQPPATPRVARPQRGTNKPRKPRTLMWWVTRVIIGFFAVAIIGMLAYGATKLAIAISVGGGSATTTNDFLSSLKSADYDQAYSDLSATATTQISRDDFKKMALADDHCYGQVTDYNEVDNSATSSADGNMQSFAYTISRSKLAKPYELHLSLQKEANGDWQVTSYGDDLGPASPTCK
jgi:hypothetical protein